MREDGKELGKWGNSISFTYEDLDNHTKKTAKAYLNSYAQARDKTATSAEMGIGGVMVFRAFCDAPFDSESSLHRAIGEVVKQEIGIK